MSALPANVTQELIHLLTSLTSPDNSLRQTAEKSLNNDWIAGGSDKVEALLVGLSEQAVMGESTTGRSFSAVLFRRICTRQPVTDEVAARIVDTLSDPAIAQIKLTLLQGFTSESNNEVRHKVSDAIAELARPGTKTGQWPELLNHLLQGSKDANPGVRESAFRVLATVPEMIGEELVEQAVPIFLSGFKDESERVRISAVNAFTQFFQTLSRSAWKTLNPLLPDLLNVLTPLREQYKSDELSSVLESLIDLAGLAPKMFRPMFKTILDFCVAVAQDKDMDMNARLSALELATTFADEAPNMVKKEPTYTEQMVMQCLAMMTEVGEDDDDAAEWNNEDDVQNSDDNDEAYAAAKQSLDRLALKLGGQVMLPPLFQWLPSMMSSTEWRQRHAALMALSNVAEGCRDVMIGEIDKVLDMVIPLLDDAHPRVQWATCNALGQMSTDFATVIQAKCGPRILPALISKLGNQSVPRVQAHAAAAMVNFSERASKEVLEPYLDSLLSSLLVLLESPKRYVQEQVLTTIAIVADAAESKFSKYYDTLMGLLFNVMKADTPKEYRLLKAKAIECSTLIALAVGKEQFLPQCQEMITIFANIQQSITDSDDPCQSYLVHAWGRLCRIIGKAFVPYLGGVMPPLLEAAKHKPDLALIEDENQIDQYDQQEGWEIIPIQGKYIGIHTSMLDEKASAIDLLSVYACELGADFYPYVKEVVFDVILTSLNFFYHDGVRYAASQAVPHLLTCAQLVAEQKNGGNKQNARQDPIVMELWNPILKKMVDVLKVDALVDVLAGFYNGISESIELLGPGCLSPSDMDALTSTINGSLRGYAERAQSRNGDDDEYAEDVEEEDAESADEELIGEISKCIHAIFKTARANYLPSFDKLVPVAEAFLASDNDDCRHWSLCVFDDLIEYTGAESWRYHQNFLPKMVDALVSGDANVRQAAAYGIGVAAQHGGEPYVDTVLSALQILFNVVNVPDAHSEDNILATENATAAIAKILRHHGFRLGADLDAAIAKWIEALPIISDDECAPFAYLFLSDLIDQSHPAVKAQVPKVFDSVAQALVHASIQGKTTEKVVQSTRQLLGSIPQEEAMGLFQKLPVESQQTVQKWFQ